MFKFNKNLLKGSFILLIAFNLYNIINFFFQFSMARFLSIADYGVLATLYSMIYMSGIFSESIQTIMAKYASSEKKPGKIKNLHNRSLRKGFKFFFVIITILFVISIPLSFILDISLLLLILNSIIISSAILYPINRGIMLGRKMFVSLSFNLVIEATSKIILAILLVSIGWKVYGAIIATIIATILAFIFSFSSLKKFTASKEEHTNAEGIYQYSSPVILTTLAITAFFSLDVIIAKIVFDSSTAGAYAIVSTVSKIIFWGTAPISKAMFPLSAENGSDKKKSSNILFNSFVFLAVCISAALLIFYLFPDFIIVIFSGKQVPDAVNILFYVGLSMGILSFTNLILLNKLSLGKTKGYRYLLVFVVLESLLLFLNSSSLAHFSLALVVSSAIFLIGSLLFLKE